MSRTIRSVLSNLFGDAIEKDFHANSVRKTWDTHFYSNIEAMGSVVFIPHLNQTGHTEATAIKNYVVTGDKMKTLNIYLSALFNLEQSSVGTDSTEECSSSKSLPRLETREINTNTHQDLGIKVLHHKLKVVLLKTKMLLHERTPLMKKHQYQRNDTREIRKE